jgi:hypothetical protein
LILRPLSTLLNALSIIYNKVEGLLPLPVVVV